MRVKRLEVGTELQEGDIVKSENALGGIHYFKIYRTTKTLAVGKLLNSDNDSDFKFRRSVEIGQQTKAYQKWCTTEYSCWRPL